jgi:hypothetical protein
VLCKWHIYLEKDGLVNHIHGIRMRKGDRAMSGTRGKSFFGGVAEGRL